MTILTLLYVCGGGLGLYLGAEWLVRGGAALALRIGIAPLVIGLTVISTGTSAPELVVSVNAAATHDSTIVLGNVIGSNIANLGLVLGLAAMIRPLRVEQQVIRREIPVMLAASGLLCLMLWNGFIARWEGAVLVLLLVAYTVISVRMAQRATSAAVPAIEQRWGTGWSVAVVVGGLAVLLPGAHFFVLGAVEMATHFGLSPMVTGLTIVAVGTSMPEIATSCVGAWRNQGDLAIGNAVGSNIFNLLGVLGISALLFEVQGVGVSVMDLLVMLFFACISLPIMWTGFVISRREGVLLVLTYALYITWLLQTV